MTLLALLLLFAQASFGGSQQTGKSSIQGVVLRAGTTEIVAGAHVTLTGRVGPQGVHVATTDGSGKFVFSDLDPAAYRLSFAAPGYVKQEYGQRPFTEAGTPVTVGSGEALKDLVMRLTPAGNLSGRVRDTFDQPIGGITVLLLQYSYADDGDKLLKYKKVLWPCGPPPRMKGLALD